MLCLKSVTRIWLRQSNCRNHRMKEIFNETYHLRKESNRCFYNAFCKTVIKSMSYESSYLTRLHSWHHLIYRRIMGQAAIVENDGQPKNYFQQLMYSRKKQAKRSLLLQIAKKEDIPYAFAVCESYGSISNVYSYSGDSDNHYLLLEFSEENAAKNLLLNCRSKSVSESFPISTRLIQFVRRQQTDVPKMNIAVVEDSKQTYLEDEKKDISDIIKDTYSREKLSELSTRIRYFFCILIEELVSGLFPYCDVIPFGSSVNGIGRQGCDLDVMIKLHSDQIRDNSELYFLSRTCKDVKDVQRNTLHCIGDMLRIFIPGFVNVQKILNARMPIIKLHHRLLKMNCDISVNNVSPILMSEIIHFCGEIDIRVRPLLHAVKKWAKLYDVTSKNSTTHITNFGLTALVLFFLQNRPNPIVPPFNEALIIQGEDLSPDFRIEFLKSTEELRICASSNTESLASLLKEFLVFLGTFPFKKDIISLMSGKSTPRNNETPIWIQYPIEEGLNITQNVSEFESIEMYEKARHTAKLLENHISQNVHFTNLKAALGASELSGPDSLKAKETNEVSSLLDENTERSKNKANIRGIS